MKNSFRQPNYTVNPHSNVIPGLKVAYGTQTPTAQPSVPSQNKSWLGRLKKTVVEMVTEEAEADRPIGIAQLSRRTFTAHADASARTPVQNQPALQDYRFRFIAENHR